MYVCMYVCMLGWEEVGQRPQRGQSPVERRGTCLSICPLVHWLVPLGRCPAQPIILSWALGTTCYPCAILGWLFNHCPCPAARNFGSCVSGLVVFLYTSKAVSVGPSVGWLLLLTSIARRVTHLFDDPHGAHTWLTGPCYQIYSTSFFFIVLSLSFVHLIFRGKGGIRSFLCIFWL